MRNTIVFQYIHYSLFLALGLILYFGLLSLSAQAHSSGVSIEKEVDGYLIDIGHSPEELQIDTQTRFDFNLYDVSSGREVDFTNVWVRLEKENNVYLATGLGKAKYGLTNLSLRFVESGSYNLYVRFSNEDGSLVETELPLTITENDYTMASNFSYDTLMWPGMLTIGLVVSVYFWRRYVTRIKSSRVMSAVLKRSTQTFAQSHFADKEPLKAAGYWGSGILAAVVMYAVVWNMSTLFLDEKPVIEYVDYTNQKTVEVAVTRAGFAPQYIEITPSTTVTFYTPEDISFWPASNQHPNHTEYSEFDASREMARNEEWSFTFTKQGNWGMHDHLRAYNQGAVLVSEKQ